MKKKENLQVKDILKVLLLVVILAGIARTLIIILKKEMQTIGGSNAVFQLAPVTYTLTGVGAVAIITIVFFFLIWLLWD